eukprot:350853-Chlamydomonas_euryale.AAC.5
MHGNLRAHRAILPRFPGQSQACAHGYGIRHEDTCCKAYAESRSILLSNLQRLAGVQGRLMLGTECPHSLEAVAFDVPKDDGTGWFESVWTIRLSVQCQGHQS